MPRHYQKASKRYLGPETEGVAAKDGVHVSVAWTRVGVAYHARVYNPHGAPLSDALVDMLVYALEQRPERVMTESQSRTISRNTNAQGEQ